MLLALSGKPAYSSVRLCGQLSRAGPADFARQPLCPSDTPAPLDWPLCFRGCRGDVRWNTRLGINLWRPLRVGCWNVLSLSDDHRLLSLAGELMMLMVDIVRLFNSRRPGSGENSAGQCVRLQGISHRHLQPTAPVCGC